MLWGAAGTVVLPFAVLGGLAATTPIPDGMDAARADTADRNSLRVTDRTGTVLAEVRDEAGMRERRLPLSELGDPIQRAILAAEDARFYGHPGVDPLAMIRAAATSALEGHVVSGASTLTQQLARHLLSAPRTLRSKIEVMALAVRLEATYPKRRILEAYLNRIEFGPNVRGVEAASWRYFGKPARSLSLGEAAALASIPRGPTLYDPNRNPTALLARRNRILDRMARHGLSDDAEVRIAKAEQLVVGGRFRSASAPHFVAALTSGGVDPCRPAMAIPADAVAVETTLLADLQREIEQAARATVRQLESRAVTAASVVVLSNDTGDVLAYVGSPDALDEAHLGGNDGCLAKRQPGSTLKPFIYGLAMEELSMTPATLLPDVELSFVTPDGSAFRPNNYDERFHGPVMLRHALGNSFNVPAVWLAERLGPSAVLERLHAARFCSLTASASHYGVGIALGDGEVTLVELATAYATLARGGRSVVPRSILSIERAASARIVPESPVSEQVFDAKRASLVTDILRDRKARLSSFGEETVFDLPFEVAAKTGTSKGYRDNWAVGYTPELTVAVWVGNFDGSPMKDVSGVTGAGPLFRQAMLAASRYFAPTSFDEPDARRVSVCALSGRLPGPHCPHERKELIPNDVALETCDMHVSVTVDTKTGERAGPSCDTDVEARIFEHYPPLLMPWARATARNLVPATFSKRCPGPSTPSTDTLRILYPHDGARFYLTDAAPSFIRVTATFAQGATSARFLLDGRPIEIDDKHRGLVKLEIGNHTLVAKDGDLASEPVEIIVE